jgi:hypothetical protein
MLYSIVLAAALVVVAVTLNHKLAAARAEIANLAEPKPFGLRQLRAVAGQIVLTAETVLAATVTAAVAGMTNTLPDDIAAERASAERKIGSSKEQIAALTEQIAHQRGRITAAEALQTELASYAALLPSAPTPTK